MCLKTQEALSCHLRRVCMKKSTEADITRVVEKAKQEAVDVLKTGRAFSYAVLCQIISSSNPLQRLVASTLLSVTLLCNQSYSMSGPVMHAHWASFTNIFWRIFFTLFLKCKTRKLVFKTLRTFDIAWNFVHSIINVSTYELEHRTFFEHTDFINTYV